MYISTSVDIQATTISLLLVMMMNFITKRTNNRRLARVVFGGLAMLLIRLLQKFINSLGKLTYTLFWLSM